MSRSPRNRADSAAAGAGPSLANIDPRKSLGQHFLHDQGVLRRIAALAAPEPGSGVVEVGPGTGALTEHLLGLGCPVHAVERDDRLLPLLADRFGPALRLHAADAVHLDWPSVLGDPALGPRPVVVGNLPYNVGAAIVMALLESPHPPARLVVMLQREVADRIAAPSPSHPAWGLLSVHAGWRAEVRSCFRVGPGAFRPPPKVESAVIALWPRATPLAEVPSQVSFDRLVNAGFGQRRKQLAGAFGHSLGLPREGVLAALTAHGLRADARAEQLDLAAWAALTRTLHPALMAPSHSQEAPA